MAVNLLDLFRDAIGDQTPVKISSYLGESTENTRSAIGTVLPALLGGLLEKGRDLSGAASVLDFLNHEQIDGSILDRLDDVLAGGKNTTELIEKGAGILDFILGDKKLQDNIVDMVTNRSGTGRGSADTLTKLVAPLLMSILGHQVKSKSLDSQGIQNLLLDQKSTLEAAAPAGMFENLGYSVFTKPVAAEIIKKDAGEEDEESEGTSEGTKQSTLSKIVPWLILISVALGLLYFMKSCGGRPQADNLVDKAGADLENSLDSAASNIKKLNPDTSKSPQEIKAGGRTTENGMTHLMLQGSEKIEIKENSFIDQFFQFLNDGGDPYTRFTFDQLTFYDSTANITLTSANQLQHVVSILNAFPNTNIQIEAHTDIASTAEQNKMLSEQRGLSVKEALVAMGISSARIVSVGLGDQNAMKKNDNPAVNILSNRIDIFVTQK